MRVLVADDDLTSRTILKVLTTEWGYEPISASDGREAWNILQQEKIELLLLDWEMPHLDGPALCRMIRENYNENPPYIILLTAHNRTEDIVKGLELGANDFITKPYENTVLKARIDVGRRMISLQKELITAKERLSDLASHDELTGIYNRRSFNQRYTQEWNRARRENHLLSVAIADVDYFKKYNDTYGHLPGDICLSSVAEAIRTMVKRPGDFVARYGGEEFAILLPNTRHLESVLEHCRRSVEDLLIPHAGSEHSIVTISIGAATIKPAPKDSEQQLLKVADKQLYTAKESGRNCVKCTILS